MALFVCKCLPDAPHGCVENTDENTAHVRIRLEWNITERRLSSDSLSPSKLLHKRSLREILAKMDAIISKAQREDLHPFVRYFANDSKKTKGFGAVVRTRASTVYGIAKGCEQKDGCIEAVLERFPVLSITSELSKLIHNTWECTHFDPRFEDFDDTWAGLFKNLEHIIKAFVNTHDGEWFFYKGHYEDPNRPY